jgi:peptidoglycan/LPS O-acetylase OafA/YrhL
MLLGIVLHAAIPFVPYYGADDTGGKLLFGLFEYIHLWRMPLFFLISGYFTSMLWRRRGLRALVRHRLRRIAAPLAIFYVPVIVLVLAGIVAGYVIADVKVEDTFGQADAYEAPQSDDEQQGDESPEDDGFGFAHLWFLWHLLWLVVAFALLASTHAWWTPRGSRGPPAGLAWVLVPLSVLPFLGMQEDVLGPDTSEHILPAPAVIGFYAAFFFFGAAQYNEGDGGDPIDRLGRWWPAQLIGSLIVFGILVGEGLDAGGVFLEVAVAWMVSFGMVGAFRNRLAQPSFRVRWLSDSSYWMYLMHLPLVFVLQGVAVALGLPSILAFVAVVATTVGILAPSYHYLVRFTAIGRLLNGRRSRDDDARLRAQLEILRRS